MNTIPYLTASSVLDRDALEVAAAYFDFVDRCCFLTGLDLGEWPLRLAGCRILVHVACGLPVADDLVVEIRYIAVWVPREKNFLLFQNC